MKTQIEKVTHNNLVDEAGNLYNYEAHIYYHPEDEVYTIEYPSSGFEFKKDTLEEAKRFIEEDLLDMINLSICRVFITNVEEQFDTEIDFHWRGYAAELYTENDKELCISAEDENEIFIFNPETDEEHYISSVEEMEQFLS